MFNPNVNFSGTSKTKSSNTSLINENPTNQNLDNRQMFSQGQHVDVSPHFASFNTSQYQQPMNSSFQQFSGGYPTPPLHQAYIHSNLQSSNPVNNRSPQQVQFSRQQESNVNQPSINAAVSTSGSGQKSSPVTRDKRSIRLKRGTAGFGFNIIGGNQHNEGIYISFLLTGGPADLSGQLFRGDQLISVNSTDLTCASHDEAADALKTSGDTVNIVTQYRPEEYRSCESRMQELQDLMHSVNVSPTSGTKQSGGGGVGALRTTQKRTLYVRALFMYDPCKDGALPNKGLAFRHGDVLHVTNASDDEWWQARRVGANGEDEPGLGIVPSKRRMERKERARLKRVNFSGKDALINTVHLASTNTLQPTGHGGASGSLTLPTSGLGPSSSTSSSGVTAADGSTLERKKKSGGLFKKWRGKDTSSAGDDANSDERFPTLDRNMANNGSAKQLEEIIRSYEPVVQEELRITRPVVIFGPLKERINDELLREFPKEFASCVPHTTRTKRENEGDGVDYHFVASREVMDRDIQGHLFIEAGQYNGHLYGTSVEAVRHVASRGKHCVLDVSGMALRRLEVASLAPIAIFIRLPCPEALQSLSRRMTVDQARKAFERHMKFEAEFAHFFTAMVTGESFEQIYAEVLDVIRSNSGRTIWVTSKEPIL